MEWILALKVLFLFLGVWWTLVNTGKFFKNNDIPSWNIFLQALGIVGFIVLQFDLLQIK
ncbi:hypothetical protein [Paenibacillus naphthalenovorans]|jgi:hypothetical protein|uniref:Uncharacterized protein n=1 Tax=Paenibacillus naphthalenovorans TaxID=162209 RepID=A0A0U2VRM3_9BACL|nr:hypothetical protein [Paenibacillus naphthalenovorans]ALS22151.1 hypothetical protein IJ22_17770 [Paenibacillus naphthalenovorans]